MFGSLTPRNTAPTVQLDAAAGDAAERVAHDPIDVALAATGILELRRAAVIAVLQTINDVSENDLDDGESIAERFDANLMGAIGYDDDDEVDNDMVAIVSANAADCLISLGVDQDIVELAFGADVDDAENSMRTAIDKAIESLPTDGEDLDSWMAYFIYGHDDDEAEGQLDSAKKPLQVGKASVRKGKYGNVRYRAIAVMHHGKRIIKNERIGGIVKLTAKQKAAIRKMRRKANTGRAKHLKMLSLHKGSKMGNMSRDYSRWANSGRHVEKWKARADAGDQRKR